MFFFKKSTSHPEKRTGNNTEDALAPPPSHVSIYQRHFCKSTTSDPEEANKPENRKFSILSLGSLLSAAVFCILCIIVLVVVLVTELDKKHRQHAKAEAIIDSQLLTQGILANFPDPDVISVNGTWYAFGTNSAAGILDERRQLLPDTYGQANVQLATSTDFLNWTVADVASQPLPTLGTWALDGMTDRTPQVHRANVWAPAILQRPSDNKFVLYYSATHTVRRGTHCMGAAVSESTDPAGPYIPLNDTLACPVEDGGAIDPAAFVDVDNAVYVAWKVDGNNVGHGGSCGNTKEPIVNTPIMLQRMEDDGVTPIEKPIVILDRIADDGPLVEAPAFARSHEGIYFMFFSSGCTRAPSYDLKYATASNITGPWTRAEQPVLRTGDYGLHAPGSVGVREGPDHAFYMALHARTRVEYGGVRAVYTTKLAFNGTSVTLEPVLSPATHAQHQSRMFELC